MDIKNFTLSNGDDSIPWRLFTPDGATKDYCILWLQGWSSSMDSHREGVERMSAKTMTVFATLDPAGHGLHNLPLDESTRKQQHEEVEAVFDELQSRGFIKIIVIGGSFGGYQGALLTGTRPVHAAVLRAPANYLDDEYEVPYKNTIRSQDYGLYTQSKAFDEGLVNSTATKAIVNYKGPVFVLEHELDEVVPANISKHYFNNAKHGNYFIIPKTEHSPKTMPDPQAHFEYIEHVIVSIIQSIKLADNL